MSIYIPALQGTLVAFGLILPLGVQNTFVFFQGVLQPRLIRAVPVAIAAGVCDTFLILTAVAGLSLIVQSATWFYSIFSWFGVLFLIYFGFLMWRSAPNGNNYAEKVASTPMRQVLFAVMVSILNPHAIIDTVGVIGTMSLQYKNLEEKAAFTAACIAVSWAWFFFLITAGNFTRRPQFSTNFLCWLKRISAIIMWIVAIQLGYKNI